MREMSVSEEHELSKLEDLKFSVEEAAPEFAEAAEAL